MFRSMTRKYEQDGLHQSAAKLLGYDQDESFNFCSSSCNPLAARVCGFHSLNLMLY
jgi:hypothetical protein